MAKRKPKVPRREIFAPYTDDQLMDELERRKEERVKTELERRRALVDIIHFNKNVFLNMADKHSEGCEYENLNEDPRPNQLSLSASHPCVRCAVLLIARRKELTSQFDIRLTIKYDGLTKKKKGG
jgi:hypothetical protein